MCRNKLFLVFLHHFYLCASACFGFSSHFMVERKEIKEGEIFSGFVWNFSFIFFFFFFTKLVSFKPSVEHKRFQRLPFGVQYSLRVQPALSSAFECIACGWSSDR